MKKSSISRNFIRRLAPLALSILVAVWAVWLSGCAGIVKKPEVDVVKQIAIVSVFSNIGVYNLSGAGSATEDFALLTHVTKAATGKELTAMDFGGTRIVDHAYQSFETELGKVNGWRVVPESQFLSKPAYVQFLKPAQQISESMGMLGKIAGAGWVVHKGMRAYPLEHMEPKGSAKLAELAELCKALGVDAVAVIQIDNAFTESTSFMGNGTAKAAVAASLKLVTKNADYAVVTLDVGKKSGRRIASKNTTGMLRGSISFDKGVEEMYYDAVDQNAVALRETINKELK